MALVQTAHAPEILSVDVLEDEATKERQPVVRLGKLAVHIEKVGRRHSDGFDRVTISLADLKTLAKEGYRLGWSAKCLHIEGLMSEMTKAIGT
jgi:hypothetical protein